MHSRLLAALALAALFTCAGCPQTSQEPGGPTGPAASGALAEIKARGKLRIAMDVGYDPFEVKQPDGQIVGYDVDLARAIAKDLGVELEMLPVDWDGIIPFLLTGKCDAILSGMSITDERKKAVDFSQPYHLVGQAILKRKDDERIKSWKDLDDPGMTVTTQLGTTGEQAIKKSMPKATLRAFSKADEACLDVAQGKADAVVFDHPFLLAYLKNQPGQLEGLWDSFTEGEPIGVAIRKDSPDLRDAVDATLKRLEQSGELAQLKAKWFSPRPESTGGGATGGEQAPGK